MPSFPSQPAEWWTARAALLCEPNIETLFALLATHSANFLRPFALEKARAEHRAFRSALEAAGVRVYDLREALAAQREPLLALARQSIRQEFDLALTQADQAQLTAQLEMTLDALDSGALADLILLRPTLHMAPNPDALDPTSRFLTRFEMAPATNAYYVRDPMITTAAGCVVGRLKLESRQPENAIAEVALRGLGIEPLYRVQAPGHLEGGDFLPCGDFVLQGQGLLSDAEGVQQCLEHRVYGYVEVGVVQDPRANMDEMHLDTYFTVFDRDLCALCANRFGAEEPIVTVYQPDGTPDQFFHRRTQTLPFTTYLSQKGFTILTFTKEEQEAFAPNGVLVGPRRWLGVRGSGAAFAAKLEAAGVAATWLDFDALTGGYGGPHCSSQILHRALELSG
jgi:arginine deiminase